MARIVTLAFDVPGTSAQEGEFVSTLPGVYWRVAHREVLPGEVRLQLWPVNGHDADPLNGKPPRELPMRMAREVADPMFGPSGAAA